MNEPAFADEIRRALDEGLEQLPYRVTNRLEHARSMATRRLAEPASVHGLVAARAGAAAFVADSGEPGRWLRLLTQAACAASLAIGLFAVSDWSDQRRAQDLADTDVALLADDVPLAIYADKGFGVYLRNSNQ